MSHIMGQKTGRMIGHNSKGVSLLEMVIGMALLLIGLYAISSVFLVGQKHAAETYQRVTAKADLALFSGMLQKHMAGGDSRFFAFSGKSLPTDRPLARMLLPLPGLCRDLSVCAEDTAYLYVHYDRTATPAVSAICALNETNVVIDLANSTFGDATLDKSNPGKAKFRVKGSGPSAPSGDVPIDTTSVLALLDPPLGSLWRATATPTALALKKDAATGSLYIDTPGDLPEACVKNAVVNKGTGMPEQLVKVPIDPFVIGQFTGGSVTGVNSADRINAMGVFPMRFMAVVIRSVGMRNTAPSAGTFGYTDCTLASDVIQCSGNDSPQAFNVQRARISQSFSLQLASAPAEVKHYEILRESMASSVGCGASDSTCRPLYLKSMSSIPVAVGGVESFETLSASEFSFIKQEALYRVRFLIALKDGKEQQIDVRFQ